MAFGFGFNKQKILSAAEKCVQQGKLQNAISEYEKILKNDTKDLTVSNTVGDLYARLGDIDKATDCFKAVGDAYASQGFTVKAIAMYKKISKLKPAMENLLKLGELYTQQGLFNDARAQYLQVAEEFLKSGELENAVRIFQKILEMDPENVNMRVRLAEVYVRLGKKNEAWQIFVAAAESLRTRGSLSGAEEVLQRMLTIDPGNSYALLMQARILLGSGDAAAAIAALEKVADLDSNPDGMRDLLKAYLQTGRLSEAGTLANKLLSVHNDVDAISSFADALMQAGQYETALQVYNQHSDRFLAENSDKILSNLHSIIGHVRENPESLQKLLDLLQKAGETTHINEVVELLAHASVQSGDLARARDLYQKLAAAEPQNSLHIKSYQQMVSQLNETSGTKLITPEEAAVIVDELEATAPSVHQHYPDATALAVRSALTDAELFISYNMPAKALGPLLAALPQAPKDLRLNQRLAALHTRAGRFAEAAVCCRTLQELYSDAGYPEEATRYNELAERYEERTVTHAAPQPSENTAPVAEHLPSAAPEPKASAAAASASPTSPWPVAAPLPHHVPQIADHSQEFMVAEDPDSSVAEMEPGIAEDLHAVTQPDPTPVELDLSSEWDQTLAVEESPAVSPHSEFATESVPESVVAANDLDISASGTPEETIEELRFYLSSGMPEQAWAALAKLQILTQDENLIEQLRAEIDAACQNSSVDESAIATIEELQPDDIPVAEIQPGESTPVAELGLDEPAFQKPHSEIAVPASNHLQEFTRELDASIGADFAPETISAEAAPALPIIPASPELVPAAAHSAPFASNEPGSGLGEFVSDLESSLGDDFLKNAPAATPATAAMPQIPASVARAATASAAAAAPALVPVSPTLQSTTAASLSNIPAPPTVPPAPASKLSPFGEEAGVDLAEMFGELKQDLEAGVATADEDPETHYNLGIAFREMGLLDEAIGELQKTCQAVDRGHPFGQVMQTYTWLAQCFLDKNVPEAAVRWYQKALITPGIDQETRTALHYELAAACESAGDKPAALKHFMEVYGNNIDYRDVAERIKGLKS